MANKKISDKIARWALIVSIISLLFTITLGIFTYSQNQDVQNLQREQNNLQKSYTNFDKAYNLLDLNKKIVEKQKVDCLNATNKTDLLINEMLLENATKSLRDLDSESSLDYLKKIDQSIECSHCYNCSSQAMLALNLSLYLYLSLILIIIIIFIIVSYLYFKLKQKSK